MDRNKLVYISRLPHGEDVLIQALNGEEGITIPQLARRFGVQDVLNAVKDQPFMASLLYYFGVLTLAGQGVLGQSILNIPNLVARSLYVERLREVWLPTFEDRETIPRLAEAKIYRRNESPASRTAHSPRPLAGSEFLRRAPPECAGPGDWSVQR